MLIEFTVGNFRSFAEPVTLSMEATKLRSQDPEVDERNSFNTVANQQLLKVATIYGANASGKSNLLKALRFMTTFVQESSLGVSPTGNIAVEPFRLRTDLREQPSFFQIVFLLENMRVQYGFTVSKDRVHSEWLDTYPKGRKRSLFTRSETDIVTGKDFVEGRLIAKQGLTRPNSLFLTVVAQFQGAQAQKIVNFLGVYFTVIDLPTIQVLPEVTKNVLFGSDKQLKIRHRVVEIVTALDLGILGLEPTESRKSQAIMLAETADDYLVEESAEPNGKEDKVRVRTLHELYDPTGKVIGEDRLDLLNDESEGTRKLFGLAWYIQFALTNGTNLFIDELDSSLHPSLTREILTLFQDAKSNPRNAQIVVTTHDTSLLDKELLRRDQIWFVEKNRFGVSHLYSLAEFQVRNDAPFERDYIRGRYGAIPLIGDLTRVFDLDS